MIRKYLKSNSMLEYLYFTLSMKAEIMSLTQYREICTCKPFQVYHSGCIVARESDTWEVNMVLFIDFVKPVTLKWVAVVSNLLPSTYINLN